MILLAVGPVHTAVAQIYVVNSGASTITSYATSASGDASPSTTITDTSNLQVPYAIAVNPANLFAGSLNNSQITVYSRSANGTSPTPTATITDSTNGMGPSALAVDSNYIYLANTFFGPGTDSVAIYSLSANGNSTPVAVIKGANTGMFAPSGIAVDANNIYVSNAGSGTITVFPITTSGSVTTGNVTPTRTITGLIAPSGLAVNATNIYVSTFTAPGSPIIAVYALSATGAATPTATFTTADQSTGLSNYAYGLAIDSSQIYVSQNPPPSTPPPAQGSARISIFPLSSSGVVSPTATISGSTNTGLNGPLGIAVGAVTSPVVSSIAPSTGSVAGGTLVTITGTNFTSDSTVAFGSNAGTSVTVTGTTQITALSPAGVAGAVHITVTTAGGTSGTSNADQFTYLAAPTVTSVSPSAGLAGTGTVVTLTGTNFGSSSSSITSVTYGTNGTGSSLSGVTWLSSTSLAGTLGNDVTAGAAVKFIVTVNGVSSAPSTTTYSGVAAPTVTTVSPSAGLAATGTVVTLTGTNFGSSSSSITSVTYGAAGTGSSLSGVTWLSSTSLTGTLGSDIAAGAAVKFIVAVNGVSSAPSTTTYSGVAAPTVTSISPSSNAPLSGGTLVTITGTNFTPGSTVTFGGAAGTNVTVVSSSQITALSPAGTAGSTVEIRVTTAGGPSGTSIGDSFTYASAPIIVSISPRSGSLAAGTPVTITGTNFTPGSTVAFGSNPGTSVIVTGTTQITALSPAGAAGPVDITVTTAGGTSGTSTADQFTYITAPTVTAVSPSAGLAATGTVVTLTGTNFGSSSSSITSVTYGAAGTGSSLSGVTWLSSTSLTGMLGSDVAPGAAVKFIVAVNGVSSAPSTTTYSGVAAPTVTSISPSSNAPLSGGTLVTITGTNFTPGSTVAFGGPAGTSVTVTGTTQITALSPAGAAGTVVDIRVTTAGGTSGTSNADKFTYAAAPTIVSISPSSGSLAAGTAVTITGMNFTPGSIVKFGTSAPTSITIYGSTIIVAVSPSGSSGPVDITVTTAGGTSGNSAADQFTYATATTTKASSASVIPNATQATPSTFASGFFGLEGLLFDAQGNLYGANYNSGIINKVSSDGKTTSVVASGFSHPAALAFDTKGNLYVPNYTSGIINQVSSDGKTTSIFASGFSAPFGVAFDTQGKLYVANYTTGVVNQVSSDGKTTSVFASGLSSPTALAFDSQGKLYVANDTTGVVNQVSSDGKTTSVFASGFSSPIGLAFDTQGNLYVANLGGGIVSKVSSDGKTTSVFASGLDSPDAVAFDPQGNLYVACQGSGIVEKFVMGAVAQLSATVTGAAGTVNEGSVTFTVLNSGIAVGSPVAGTVANGTVSVTYPLPAGTAPGSYTIQTAYLDTGGQFLASSDGSQVLTVVAPPKVTSVAFNSDGSGLVITGTTFQQATGSFVTIGGSTTALGTGAVDSFVSATQINVQLGSNFTIRPGQSIALTVTLPNGTAQYSGSIGLPSNPLIPTVFLSAPSTVALGSTGGITATVSNVGAVAPTYAWSSVPAGLVTNTNGSSALVTPTASGSLTVNLTVTSFLGATASSSVTITVPSIPAVSIQGSATVVTTRSNNLTLSGTATTATGAGPVTYQWSNSPGGKLSASSSAPNLFIPANTLTAGTTYTFTLTATDLYGQSASASVLVAVSHSPLTVSFHGGSSITTTYGAGPYIVNVTATDPDTGLALPSSSISNSAQDSNGRNVGTFNGNALTLSSGYAGVVIVTATATTDTRSASASQTITFIYITPTAQAAPTFSGSGAVQVLSGGGGTLQLPTPTNTGVGALTWSIDTKNTTATGVSFTPSTGRITYTGSGQIALVASYAGDATTAASPNSADITFKVIGPTAGQAKSVVTITKTTLGSLTTSSAAGGPKPLAVSASAGPVAVSLSTDGSSGYLAGYIASTGQGYAVSFAPDSAGNFTVTTPTFGGTGSPVTLTITGTATLASGVTGTIQPLGITFQSTFNTQFGSTSALSGVYIAATPDGVSGTSYTMVDNQGNVFVMASASGSVAAGVGTVNASTNSFTVPLSSIGAAPTLASGTISTSSLAVSETVTTNGTTVALSGASTSPVPTTTFVNLSTLGSVAPGSPISVGFVVDGPSAKTVVLRAVGPGLAQFGVSGVLAAPTLTLYNSSGTVLGTNSNWGGLASLASAFAQVGAFALSPTSADAALQTTLPPGAYTFVLSDSAKDAGGKALAEIYDASPDLTEVSQSLVNVSTLGSVTASAPLSAGFYIQGNTPKTVLIRAVGPGLAPFGVSKTLGSPSLAVVDASGNLQAQNNAWGTPSQASAAPMPAIAAAIALAEANCGAFPLATGSADSAVVVTLNPGSYTAVVSGLAGATGTALVEVYELH